MKTKRILAALIVCTLIAGLTACGGTAPAPAPSAPVSESDATPSPDEAPPPSEPVLDYPAPSDSPETTAKYLAHYFNVNLPETVTHKSFTDAITATGAAEMPDPENADGTLKLLDAVKYAVIGAGMEELALVIEAEEASRILGAFGSVDTESISYLACAYGAGIVSENQAELAASNPDVDRDTANAMILAVATESGLARTYFAYTTDPDFAQKLNNTWETFEILSDDVLLNIGTQSVMNKITTGFNIRKSSYDSRFLPELTLRYGHSSIEHARQLVSLLASRNIVAKVNLEPKTSIYEYLPEWGDPGEPSDTYKVETINDNLMLAYASEYDLVFEFENQDGRAAFDDIIKTYAKKNSGEEGKSLIRDSWWQPLYVSHVEMGAGYQMIYDNVITNGKYSLHPFSLPEAMEDVSAKLGAIDTSVTVVPEQIWCNDAFFRYLHGEAE